MGGNQLRAVRMRRHLLQLMEGAGIIAGAVKDAARQPGWGPVLLQTEIAPAGIAHHEHLAIIGLTKHDTQLAATVSGQRNRQHAAIAEVLEPDDRQRIAQAFGGLVHQLYQCTEGFLGYTCEHGVMHLNEEFVHIEPEWLDQERKRFVPIVTDFTRTTQQVIRYRLNDILRVRDAPCTCGRVTMALEAVEGRCDDILWLPRSDNGDIGALYPDMLRHAVTTAPHALPDYRIEQHGLSLRIAVSGDDASAQQVLIHAITAVALRHGLQVPVCVAMPFVDTDLHVKRRRIICRQRPAR